MKDELDEFFGESPSYITNMTTKLNEEIEDFLTPNETTTTTTEPEKSLDEQLEEFLNLKL